MIQLSSIMKGSNCFASNKKDGNNGPVLSLKMCRRGDINASFVLSVGHDPKLNIFFLEHGKLHIIILSVCLDPLG